MERFAKDAETASAYTMNAEVVSDTEEWHKRKQSSTKKLQEQQTSKRYRRIDKSQLLTEYSKALYQESLSIF